MLRAVAQSKRAQLRCRPEEGAGFFFRWAAVASFDAAPQKEWDRLFAHARNLLGVEIVNRSSAKFSAHRRLRACEPDGKEDA